MSANRRLLKFAVIAVVCAVVWLASAHGSVHAEGLYNAKTFTLDNGMQVVTIENHRAPIVVHMVWYRIGAADEPVGKSGIAHFLEHLMFKGTERFGPGEFSRSVALNGGQENAFTSWDYTGYYQKVARDRLEIVMELEADRMRNLQLTDEVVAPERQVILEERNSRTDNDPAALLSEQISAALFLHHPYGTPVIGWRHEMEALSRDDAIKFYNRNYQPNNAILVVSGDITEAELKPLAEKYYGVIPAGDVAPRERPVEPPHRSPRRVSLTDERVAQASVTRQYLAPSYNKGMTELAVPLQVFSEILGDNSTSRLYQALAVDRGLAAWAGASYSAVAVDQTRFHIYARALPGVDAATLEAAMDEVLDDVLTNGVTEEEVAAAKERMQATAVYALDDPGSVARIFGWVLSAGLTVEDVERWPDTIAAVTRDQVMAAARAVLRPERSVTGILLPDTPQETETSSVSGISDTRG